MANQPNFQRSSKPKAPGSTARQSNTVAKESGASVVEIDQLPLDWDAELRKTAQIFAKSL